MKLITWNVQWFCGLDGRVDVARVVRHAQAMADFDVLCLQEVAVNYPQLKGDASHDQPALVRSLLPGFEVCFGAAVDELADDGSGRRRFGNLIASRLPVAQVQHHVLVEQHVDIQASQLVDPGQGTAVVLVIAGDKKGPVPRTQVAKWRGVCGKIGDLAVDHVAGNRHQIGFQLVDPINNRPDVVVFDGRSYVNITELNHGETNQLRRQIIQRNLDRHDTRHPACIDETDQRD